MSINKKNKNRLLTRRPLLFSLVTQRMHYLLIDKLIIYPPLIASTPAFFTGLWIKKFRYLP
ncbi:MAG: hypothetical protein NUV83_02810 [Candidatus Wolfebacteria bacterium]|nr:hypothetical protein [Candidatus Wolfebacteria bacterium]